MANAIAGVGTLFQRWDGEEWDTIAEINSIEGPTMDKDNIDVTSLDTAGGYDEFITGFMDGGQLVLNMNFTRSGYEVMKSDFEIDVARDYRIVLPDDEDTTLEFEGLVIEIPLTMEAEDKLTADVTIQVTGEVVVASAGAESSVDVSVDTSSEDAYDADLVTYWTGLSTPLSTGQKDDLNTFILAIKAALGITNLSEAFDTMWVLANETSEAALRNLVARANDCELVSESTKEDPTFVQFRGFYNKTVDSYINTNFNPDTQGSRYDENTASWGFACLTDDAGQNNGDMGGMGDTTAKRVWLTISTGAASINYSINTPSRAISNFYDSRGFYIATKSGATTIAMYRNGYLVDSTIGSTEGERPNANVYLCCQNSNGVPAGFNTFRTYAFVFFGKLLTAANVLAVSEAWDDYLVNIGQEIESSGA